MRKYAVPLIAVLLVAVGLAGRYAGTAAGIADPQPIVVVVVEETSQRPKLPKEQIVAMNSLSVRSWLFTHGSRLFLVDRDVVARDDKPPAALVPFLDRAKGKKLPHMVIANKAGKVLYDGDFPDNENLLMALLQANYSVSEGTKLGD